MKAYIQTDKNNEFSNINVFTAYEGFKHFGFELEKYFHVDEIKNFDPECIVVGGIGNVRKRLKNLGFEKTEKEIDYPDELKSYLKRKMWNSTLEEILDNQQFGIFVKPELETKKFTGKVLKNELDLIGLIDRDNPTPVFCSELVDFKTEFRCFVRYKTILDIRRYKGEWDKAINIETVKNAIEDFTHQPAAFALDFGINEKNETILVEVNDGHSLGCYGMTPQNYAKFLSARWSEMTNTKDYLNF